MLTFWENIEVIKIFAGEDFEKPKYYNEDKNFLLEFEKKMVHYEVFAEQQFVLVYLLLLLITWFNICSFQTKNKNLLERQTARRLRESGKYNKCISGKHVTG